jgi:hypothetical protein
MKVINKDAALTALKCKLRECVEANDTHTAVITRCVIQIMTDMPEMDVNDGVECGSCFFFDKDKHRCIHKNGLGGRIRKGMYCSYGSFHADDIEDEEDEDEFGEFDD